MRLSWVSILLLIFVIPQPSVLNSKSPGEVQIDMTSFGKVWKDYISNPNGENALRVYSMLPDGKDREIRLQVEVRPLIINNLVILESQIFSGDRDSLRVAFRLFTIADTALEEELGKILGNYIRFNARSCLRELNNHRDLVPYLSLIVCSFQFTLRGDTTGQGLERKARLKAMEYVDDGDLKAIKKECIKTLKKCKIK
ncbi:MAG: hypothetical protein KAT34_13455 [Candidatus Aminicenantes bacterium]|nr:hypothetical protein [Candidatus Aminicenantes bacterium]